MKELTKNKTGMVEQQGGDGYAIGVQVKVNVSVHKQIFKTQRQVLHLLQLDLLDCIRAI